MRSSTSTATDLASDHLLAPRSRKRTTLKRTHNIRRVDHHHFHGWLVCLKRAGSRHERYFHDQGDRRAALGRARAWRDQMAARLPPPRKFKRSYALNKTGVVGVQLVRTRTLRGTRVRYYCATWVDDRGQRRKRSFSVAKYGAEQAFDLAVSARRKALAVLLRPARVQ